MHMDDDRHWTWLQVMSVTHLCRYQQPTTTIHTLEQRVAHAEQHIHDFFITTTTNITRTTYMSFHSLSLNDVIDVIQIPPSWLTAKMIPQRKTFIK